MANGNSDQIFIRQDLEKTSGGGVAYYRLPKELKDFINLCRTKHGDIEAIVLTKDVDGNIEDYHWNIGFVLPKEKE